MLKLLLLIWTLLAASAAVECPDKGNCDEGQTCCSSPNNEYQCCPFEQAECCEDHIHCCPSYTVCDQISSSCINATVSIPWMDRTSAAHPMTETSFWQDWLRTKQGKQKDNYITCNGTSLCPDGCTCCMGTVQKWECCPLPQAVCCADYRHCCPHGQRCNLAKQRCDTDLESMPWFEKIPAIQRKDVEVKDMEVKEVKVKNVSCDQNTACPDGTTCCRNIIQEWSCCPLPNAVCCLDYRHCCPHGQRCNLAKQRCDTDLESVPWFEKISAIQRKDVEVKDVEVKDMKVKEVKVKNVSCDQNTACPDGTTCCRNIIQQWSCCPLPNAVCCLDYRHCCPHGQRCNLEKQRCDTDLQSVPWFEKIPAIQRKDVEVKDMEVKEVKVKNVSCDQNTACPDGTTCCRNIIQEWSCCPLPNAVCCSDYRHCCPHGQRCNLAKQRCDTDLQSVPWFEKIPAIQMKDVEPEGEDDGKMEAELQPGIKCDATSSCPALTTCCFMEDFHKYGCCPLPKAVCCLGGMYCCPESYTCNMQTKKCVRGDEAIPWFSKRPILTKAATFQPDYRQCDGTSQCPALSTCCRLPVGEWGCCPLQDAVCCSGSSSCCPKGYSCSEEGQCIRKARLDWSMWKMLLSDKKDPEFM